MVINDFITLPEFEKPTFIVAAHGTANAANKSMLSIVNTEATFKFAIREIWIANVQTTAVSGATIIYELRKITDHTGGTLLTTTLAAAGGISANDSADALPSGFTARTNATVSGQEAFPRQRWLFSTDEWGVGGLDQEGLEHTMQELMPAYTVRSGQKPITLRQNEGFHIRQNGNVTTGSFDVVFVVTQETL